MRRSGDASRTRALPWLTSDLENCSKVSFDVTAVFDRDYLYLYCDVLREERGDHEIELP